LRAAVQQFEDLRVDRIDLFAQLVSILSVMVVCFRQLYFNHRRAACAGGGRRSSMRRQRPANSFR